MAISDQRWVNLDRPNKKPDNPYELPGDESNGFDR